MDPLALQNKPVLPLYLEEYYEAFHMLNGSRRLGMGVGPIPFSELMAYLQVYPTYDIDLFIYLIHTMDNEYLKERNDG